MFETIHLVPSNIVNFFIARYLTRLINLLHRTPMFENAGPIYMLLKTN